MPRSGLVILLSLLLFLGAGVSFALGYRGASTLLLLGGIIILVVVLWQRRR